MKKTDLVVSRQNNVETITYTLGAADVFDDRAADKMTQLSSVIPIQYKDEDGKRSITAYAHEDLTLEAFMKKTLSKREVLGVISGLASVFEIGAQGIPVSYIIKDSRYIYVNGETLAVKAVLMPLKQDVMPLADMPILFRDVISGMRFNEADSDNYVARLLTLINSDDFSAGKLKMFADKMLEEMGLFVSKDNGIMGMQAAGAQPNGRDVRVNKVGVMNNMRPQPQMGQVPPQGYMPMQGQPMPQMQGRMPMQGQPMPQMQGRMPMQGQPMPQMQGRMPMQGQPMPQMQGRMPMQGQPMPQMQGRMPMQGQPVPPQPQPQAQPMPKPPMQGQPVPPQPQPQAQPMPKPPMQGQPVPPQPQPQAQPMPKPPMQGQPVPPQPQPQAQPMPKPPMQGQPVPPQPQPQAQPMPKPPMQGQPVPPQPQPQAQPMPKPPMQGQPVPPQPQPLGKRDEKSVTIGNLVGQLGAKPVPHLVRKKTGEIINITKPEFTIGKSHTKADYAIENNTAISRVHCIIIQKNGVNYIKDNDSTNHTFIDGVRLEHNQEVLLKNKMTIQLGDEEFTFLLRKGE